MAAATYQISSGFGPRWGTQHLGLDFAADDGTPIYAAQAGTVAHIGAATGFGQWIVLDHPTQSGGATTVYGHMWDAFATGLSLGDWVEAGQLIGYVGSNGGSTGPHLHFEVHPTVWRAGSQIDPAHWLADAADPVAPSPTPDHQEPAMTYFGIDIASYQAGLNLDRVAAEGFAYVIAKVTEGNGYRNPYYEVQRDGARRAGLLFGAYHYVDQDVSAAAQAEFYASVEPDTTIPVMLDCEIGSGGVNLARDLVTELSARGYRVNLLYLPRWYWSDHLGSPELSGLPPLMASRYVNGSATASELYPGDNAQGWNGYGGGNVAILQFSDKGLVADYALDVNAFKGTRTELEALFNSTEDDLPYTPDQLKGLIYECLATYCGPIGSDVKDIRSELTGGRDHGDNPGFASLYDLRAGTPVEEAFHGSIGRYVLEIDAKIEALVAANLAVAKMLADQTACTAPICPNKAPAAE
ncbi:peptidoglycan DD-metalloendopeptidase family protein [Nocardia asteroides]|uniref:peptidoglycan DD-metalloendopeptidase family protein n=1 Tax=Nocardia asteroides TaxID=1824 RepID=UPI0037CB12CB